MPNIRLTWLGLCFACICVAATSGAQEPAGELTSEQRQFFEVRIRPVLVQHCYGCHAAEAKEPKGGLLLDTAAALRTGGDSGPSLVLGKPDESLLIQALRYDGLEMPPGGKLPESVVRDFETWVSLGAPDPRGETAPRARTAGIDIDARREFWSFQPPREPKLPPVVDRAWPRTDIDRFILAGLEAEGLRPQRDSAPRVLARRLYFDLTGLPPTPAELAAFDRAAQRDVSSAVQQLVDQLLASPQFGVHWGRHWLDVARYADSNGGDFNATFHDAWRYRDYVVDAFNQDKPFDQFVREQLAGDLLPSASDAQRAEQLVATGFLMVGTKMLSERDKEKLRLDVVDEQLDATGAAFLGMTLGCARCHDHKFDPIPTRDYYALAGIFGSIRTLEGESQQYVSTWQPVPLPAEPEHVVQVAEFEERIAGLQQQLEQAKQSQQRAEAQVAELQSAGGDALAAAQAELTRLKADIQQQTDAIQAQKKAAPRPLPKAFAVVDLPQPIDAAICIRGDHRQRGDKVPRGFLQVVSSGPAPRLPHAQSGRLELANWIVRPDHPLTSRVLVNRLWVYLLGEGLVRSVDNFGELGERPTHPELLDYLALQFTRQGWSVKQAIREIVLSRTYQLSSEHDERSWHVDAENRWLWRSPRRRLPAEAIRDSLLAIGGQLDLSPGGSPVEGLGVLVTTNNAGAAGFQRRDSQRRSLYLPIIRSELPAMLTVFDFADPDLVTGKRPVTNVPTQALLLLNDPFVMDCAQRTSEQLLAVADPTDEARVTAAYDRILSRPPTADDLQRAVAFLQAARAELAAPGNRADASGAETEAFVRFVHVLLASTEFRILD